MKKFFEEPSIECIRLQTESITDTIGDGVTGSSTVNGPAIDD